MRSVSKQIDILTIDTLGRWVAKAVESMYFHISEICEDCPIGPAAETSIEASSFSQ
jgi:hypothetical protein